MTTKLIREPTAIDELHNNLRHNLGFIAAAADTIIGEPLGTTGMQRLARDCLSALDKYDAQADAHLREKGRGEAQPRSLAWLVQRWRKQAKDCRDMADRLGEGHNTHNELLRDAAQYEQSAWQVENVTAPTASAPADAPALYVHPYLLEIPSIAVECSRMRLADAQIPLYTTPPAPASTVVPASGAVSDEDVPLDAEWKPDCQGKQDYDADLVQLSTRYWPRGGGFSIFNTATGEFADNDARPEIKPSAKASILIQGEELASARFEGDDEAEVKAEVERWAQQQFNDIRRALESFASRHVSQPAQVCVAFPGTDLAHVYVATWDSQRNCYVTADPPMTTHHLPASPAQAVSEEADELAKVLANFLMAMDRRRAAASPAQAVSVPDGCIVVPIEELRRTIRVLRYASHPDPSPHADALAELIATAPSPPQRGSTADHDKGSASDA